MNFSLGVILFVVFLVLKLTGVIAWSWLWVTAPLWIGFALFVVMFLVIGLFAAGALARTQSRTGPRR